MKLSWKIYMVAGVVFVLSFSTATLLPISDTFKGIIAIPCVGSLLGALYQIFKDQAKFEKDQALQQKQHIFNLSVTSHMANVAFDKHVQFSEEYIQKMDECIKLLFEAGPSGQTLNIAEQLMNIRRKHTPWVTKETTSKLCEFENDLAMIGIAFQEFEHDRQNKPWRCRKI